MGTALAAILAVMIAGISVLWLWMTKDAGEIKKALFSSKKILLYFLAEALVGGAAAWATYVTAGLLNTMFAVVGVMFYPILGSALAQKWLKEKVSNPIRVGMGIILASWMLFYLPAIQSGFWGDHTWIGNTLGMLTGIGWGIESTLASRVADMIDSDTSVAVRFLWESGLWLAILAVLAIVGSGREVFDQIGYILAAPAPLFMLVLIALCLTFNYFSWYRAIALIGVTKGLVISDVSGFVTVIAGMLLTVSMPGWLDIFASLLMMAGVFWIYWHGAGENGSYRQIPALPQQRRESGVLSQDTKQPIKVRILKLIAASGQTWDYEVANLLCENMLKPARRRRERNVIRTYMIELCAAGILVSVEEDADTTGHFQQGKLLSCYQITEYGCRMLEQCGFLHK